MEKSCQELLLLSYLIWAIGPFLPYAEQYGMVKVELYPIQGREEFDIILEVQFVLCN